MAYGTAGNLSFLCDDKIYITSSGSCFGRLTPQDFAIVSSDGEARTLNAVKPSKELPLHLMLYASCAETRAVIHVHSPYVVLYSVICPAVSRNIFKRYTPYLEMKAGTVASVPYAEPGSAELFAEFKKAVGAERAYLMKNHGTIVGGTSLMNAFEIVEELEQTARINWSLYAAGIEAAVIK